MIGFLFVAALTAAKVDMDFARWIMAKSHARRSADAVAVELELWVNPSGGVERCDFTRFVGREESAKRICDDAVGKQLSPASDTKGAASYGVARVTVFATPDNAELRSALSKELNTSAPREDFKLEIGGSSPATESYFALAIDSYGIVRGCAVSSGGTPREDACSSIVGMQRSVRRAKDGATVPYVERIRVALS